MTALGELSERKASEQRLGEQAEKGRRRLARSLEPDYTGICIPYLRIWGFKIIKEFEARHGLDHIVFQRNVL